MRVSLGERHQDRRGLRHHGSVGKPQRRDLAARIEREILGGPSELQIEIDDVVGLPCLGQSSLDHEGA